MESTKCSSRIVKNSQSSYLHGNSLPHNDNNIPGKNEQHSVKFVKVEEQRKQLSDVDKPFRESVGDYLLTREKCQSSNLPSSRKATCQQHLRNIKTLESGKRHIGPSDKSLWDETHSCQQDIRKFPTMEQQLEHLIPSKELLLHYREKIMQLNNDYQALMVRVDQCQSLCDLSFQLEEDLTRRNSEVSKLQQTVSDLQVYVQQEHEQVLRLYAENDRLQVRTAEDRKKIALLLSLSHMTEHDVVYLSSLPQHRVDQSRYIKGLRDTNDKYKKGDSNNSSGVSGKHYPEGTCIEATALCAQLEERVKVHRNQVLSLLKDRDISWKERNLEQRRLQKQVSVLSKRLKDTQDQLCDVTKELVKFKKDSGNKELNWTIERNKILQNLELCQQRLGETYPSVLGFAVSGSGSSLKPKSNSQLCAEIHSLKDQLQQRESLLSMYQEQCIQLNEEARKWKEQVDISKKMFHDQTQKLAGQVTYLKTKYDDLDRRRKLEAEGFYNDIRILRGRLKDIEKSVKKFCLKQVTSQTVYPTNEDLFLTARETRTQSQQLERELKNVKRKIEEIETGIGDNGV